MTQEWTTTASPGGASWSNATTTSSPTKTEMWEMFADTVERFGDRKEMDLVAVFGSMTDFDRPDFGDIDTVTICDDETHERFISHMKERLTNAGLEPVVFQTVLNEPDKEHERQVLIHDLHYTSREDLLEKEWAPVINSMKDSMQVIHGDEDFPGSIPRCEVTREDVLRPVRAWAEQIETEGDFEHFREYVKKITPKLVEEYEHLNLEELREAHTAATGEGSWENQLNEIRECVSTKPSTESTRWNGPTQAPEVAMSPYKGISRPTWTVDTGGALDDTVGTEVLG